MVPSRSLLIMTLIAGLTRFAADTVTQATSLVNLTQGTAVPWQRLLLGNISGSFGETSAVLLILGGIYIVWKKAAAIWIVFPAIAGMLVTQTVFWLAGLPQAADPLHSFLAGSFIMGAFFIITDPVSAGQTTDLGRAIYGAFFGVMVVVVTQMGVITPPVGVNVYVVSGIERDIPLQSIFKGSLPFLLMLVVAAAILVFFPQLCLLLPGIS